MTSQTLAPKSTPASDLDARAFALLEVARAVDNCFQGALFRQEMRESAVKLSWVVLDAEAKDLITPQNEIGHRLSGFQRHKEPVAVLTQWNSCWFGVVEDFKCDGENPMVRLSQAVPEHRAHQTPVTIDFPIGGIRSVIPVEEAFESRNTPASKAIYNFLHSSGS